MTMRWQVAAARFWIKKKGRNGLLKTEASCFLLSRSAWRCRLRPLFLPGLPPHPLCFRVLCLSLSPRSQLISRPASCHSVRPYMEQHAARTQRITFLCRSRPAVTARTHADESFTHKFWIYVDFLWRWWWRGRVVADCGVWRREGVCGGMGRGRWG